VTTQLESGSVTAYTSFVTMTKPEARAYLERFLSDMPSCIDRLAAQSASTGGPDQSQLDCTAESLDALYSWAAPRFAWRAGYQPPAFRGDFRPQFTPDDLEEPEDLPSWFHHPSGVGLADFSTETLWLIDGLARYLGETVINCIPGTRWASGATRPKGNMVANHPILTGLSDEESPIFACTGLASRMLTPWLDSSHRLRSIFESWRSQAIADDQ
jgi:hypothetical protein